MEFQEFMKQKDRMCKALSSETGDCLSCPIMYLDSRYTCAAAIKHFPDRAEAIVKEWAEKHPAHYCSVGKIEPIDFILDKQLSFCLGNAVKYISRAGKKGDAVLDLLKAEYYIAKEIARLS